jgi:lyso-ornithine lipid O-acyltransferase
LTTWRADDHPVALKVSAGATALTLVRATLLAIVTYGCLALLLLVRLVERPVFGMVRPVTPWITQFVCRTAFVVMGMDYRMRGRPMTHKGAIVSNHASWLDIFALNACQRVYFVSKAEVAGWPGIGWLARATGTVFIARDRRKAKAQEGLLAERLRSGHRILFFPEGTSTDGRRVLPFKSTLFSAVGQPDLRDVLWVQPVSVIYHAPVGRDARHYGWWGDMAFGPHFTQTLSVWRQGGVEVVFHDPVRVADFPDRKALARHCEDVVRAGVTARLTGLRD